MSHPNRLPFEGVLTLVGVASDKSPSGARGHRVLLPRKSAIEAIPSLLGMAVNLGVGFHSHDLRQKCGVITDADVIGHELRVLGYVFGRDFPELLREKLPELGMSYEMANAHVQDMRAEIWTLDRFTFTGAAILRRDEAAYKGTRFRLMAGRKHIALAASAAREWKAVRAVDDPA